jgi:hypothetical protein
MEAPAIWTVYAGANPDDLNALLECVARRLSIPVPDTTGGEVALPYDQGRVVAALDACDPDWHRKALIVPQ